MNEVLDSEKLYADFKFAADDLKDSKNALAGAEETDRDNHLRPIALLLSSKDVREDQAAYDEILERNGRLLSFNLGAYQEQAAVLATAAGVELDFYYDQ